MLVCRDCNSSDVSIKVWVNINETINNKPITSYEDSEEDLYCNSCGLEQKSLIESTFSVERKKK